MPRKLSLQPWMTAPATRRVVEALTADGAEVRFVGGCVRDTLLGYPVRDIDIATDAQPEEVFALLGSAGLKAVPTGIAHGTVTAVSDGRPFEITTLRRDVETDGRHARVAFGHDWSADAARRDFTFNAMSLAPDGTLFDPCEGEADLRAGRVRFVGAPRERIAEDVLRLLRWFRFYAHYGRPPPDPDALAACGEMAPGIAGLSAERVRHEFLRLLEASEPLAALELMRDAGALGEVLAGPCDLDRLGGLLRIERMMSIEPDPLLRLAALLPRDADEYRRIAERLRLANRERDRLLAMTGDDPPLSPELDDAGRRLALYRLGRAAACDRICLAWSGDVETDGWRELLVEAKRWSAPEFPLGGKDVTALGVPAGPRVGALLRRVEDWWAAGGFEADREACLETLRRMARDEAGEAR